MANYPVIWDITLVDDDDKWYTIQNVELLNDIIDVNDLTLIEKPIEKPNDIMTKRYNFVVDLLTEEQQRVLHKWYVDTGVIEEEE